MIFCTYNIYKTLLIQRISNWGIQRKILRREQGCKYFLHSQILHNHRFILSFISSVHEQVWPSPWFTSRYINISTSEVIAEKWSSFIAPSIKFWQEIKKAKKNGRKIKFPFKHVSRTAWLVFFSPLFAVPLTLQHDFQDFSLNTLQRSSHSRDSCFPFSLPHQPERVPDITSPSCSCFKG